MGIQVEDSSLAGVMLIKPEVFEDHRGHYVELMNKADFSGHFGELDFVQTDISVSGRHVLRGFHGDKRTYKLVTCLLGRLYVVVVDCREDSPGFGSWTSFTLSETNRHLVLVPPGHGLAHLTMENKNIFYYLQSTYYDPSSQFTYKWNDERFKVWWPIDKPVLSRRDDLGHYV